MKSNLEFKYEQLYYNLKLYIRPEGETACNNILNIFIINA